MIEAEIVERFGWTFEALDEMDETRVLVAVQAMNLREHLRAIQSYLDSNGQMKPAGQSWKLWGWASKYAGN